MKAYNIENVETHKYKCIQLIFNNIIIVMHIHKVLSTYNISPPSFFVYHKCNKSNKL